MAKILKKDLFDTNASLYVLSCLMHNPLLLQDDQYVISKTDFYKPLQEMVFYAIYNMAQTGVQKITPQDIDMYIKQYEGQYEYYKQNKGYEFVLQCYQTAEGTDEKQFINYYNRLKKFSVLRDLESIGIDTKIFYDTEKDVLNRDIEDERLNRLSIEEILNSIRHKIVDVESKHIGRTVGTAQEIGSNIDSLIQGFIETPEVGLPISGEIVNYAVRGLRPGKMYLYSANSGGGKTRFMASLAADIAMPYIDKASGQVVMRDDYEKVVFIATEMELDEIQTIILAHVADVNEETILLGNYTLDELERVKKAAQIMKMYSSNFIVDCVTDPSIALIKSILTRYIIQQDVYYIFYDYIFSSPGLLSEFRDVAVREDVALMMLANSLKEIAMTYKVFIQSATQLNETGTKREIGLRDQNCIRGSKAIADKIDIGMIGVRIGEQERKLIEGIWQEIKAKNKIYANIEPNIVIDIYKNRRGRMNCIKIFRYFDYATCRCIDLFVTDANYKAISNYGKLDYNLTNVDYLTLLAQKEGK